MIIDYTYFFGKLRLPQSGNNEGRDEIDEYIETYEVEYLKKVLGYDLWKVFSAGIEGSGDPDQRWKDLLDGKEYSQHDITYKWSGFDPADESKLTPIANYTFYRYNESKASDVTLAGTSTGAVDNNTRVAPMQKMVEAWNAMVDINYLLYGFLMKNLDVYPEFDKRQLDKELFYHKNSLDI